jgi:hypothetical protein
MNSKTNTENGQSASLRSGEENVTHIKLACAVNYGEEEIPNDFPGRVGEMWHAKVNLDTGKIEGWPAGKTADIHLTVNDCGTYTLLTEDGREVAKRENNYVPHGVVPGIYGDTVELKIAADGTITNWPRTLNTSAFFNGED